MLYWKLRQPSSPNFAVENYSQKHMSGRDPHSIASVPSRIPIASGDHIDLAMHGCIPCPKQAPKLGEGWSMRSSPSASLRASSPAVSSSASLRAALQPFDFAQGNSPALRLRSGQAVQPFDFAQGKLSSGPVQLRQSKVALHVLPQQKKPPVLVTPRALVAQHPPTHGNRKMK
jgi:hypothetical protein